jgi:protein-export membrane protein SecD
MKTFLRILAILSLCVAGGFADDADPNPKGGIDKVGGTSILLRVQGREGDDGSKLPVTKEQVDQAVLVIKKRLKLMGTAKPLITRQGAEGINVQIPGVGPEDAVRVSEMLARVAKLELREVSPRSDEPGPDGETLAERVQNGTELVPGYRAFTLKGKDQDGNEYARPILLNRRVALGGSDIAIAAPWPQQNDAVAVTLNRAGTEKMIALTKNMRPGLDRIAILLDGEVISVPTIAAVPLGKNFIIEGLRQVGDAQSLANALMNPLQNSLKIEEVRTVSAKIK